MINEKFKAGLLKIASQLSGVVEGWDFSQYVLALLFFRAFYQRIDVQKMRDITLSSDPLESFNIALKEIERRLGNQFTGVFDSLDFEKMGRTPEERSNLIIKLIHGIAEVDFSPGDFLGDAYEFLILSHGSHSRRWGGEFFTPVCVSELMSRIALQGLTQVNTIYDPTCGSGSLLLRASKDTGAKLYGQEINRTTYNLVRMNMYLHNQDKFEIGRGDTLKSPQFKQDKPFDVIVSNPPYSLKWDHTPELLEDERFKPAGVLSPKSKADLAFVMHCLDYLSDSGRAVILCYPGIFYRTGAEQKIRKYLIDSNFVECVISMPENLFYATTIRVNILTLNKNKKNTNIFFIDAMKFFNNDDGTIIMDENHITNILEMFRNRDNIKHICQEATYQDVQANDYRLCTNDYVEPKYYDEEIDIDKLNQEIKAYGEELNRLRILNDRGVQEAKDFIGGIT